MQTPARGRELLPHHLERAAPGRLPLVLLNGLLMTMGAWEPVARTLRGERTLMRLAWRGQPPSREPPRAEARENVNDLLRLLDAHDLQRVHLAGTSFGGTMALLTAMAAPSRVASLTLIASGAQPDRALRESGRRWRRDLLRPDRAARREAARTLIGQFHSRGWQVANPDELERRAEALASIPPSALERQLDLVASLRGLSIGAAPIEIACPILMLRGADDRVLSEGSWDRLAAALPRAIRRTVPGAGHALALEQPGVFSVAWRGLVGDT